MSQIQSTDTKPLTFVIETSARSLLLIAADAREKAEWIDALRTAGARVT
jgi:hypothetical protein